MLQLTALKILQNILYISASVAALKTTIAEADHCWISHTHVLNTLTKIILVYLIIAESATLYVVNFTSPNFFLLVSLLFTFIWLTLSWRDNKLFQSPKHVFQRTFYFVHINYLHIGVWTSLKLRFFLGRLCTRFNQWVVVQSYFYRANGLNHSEG